MFIFFIEKMRLSKHILNKKIFMETKTLRTLQSDVNFVTIKFNNTLFAFYLCGNWMIVKFCK